MLIFWGKKMTSVKAVLAGKAALQDFENSYSAYHAALIKENEYAHGKGYHRLKEIRRLAGKVSDSMKRCGRFSRFLDIALNAYDYTDALILGSTSLPELDKKAAVCAAAMEVIREALHYEYNNGALKVKVSGCKISSQKSFAESLN